MSCMVIAMINLYNLRLFAYLYVLCGYGTAAGRCMIIEEMAN